MDSEDQEHPRRVSAGAVSTLHEIREKINLERLAAGDIARLYPVEYHRYNSTVTQYLLERDKNIINAELENPDRGRDLLALWFYGPPGTGKSFTARVLINAWHTKYRPGERRAYYMVQNFKWLDGY